MNVLPPTSTIPNRRQYRNPKMQERITKIWSKLAFDTKAILLMVGPWQLGGGFTDRHGNGEWGSFGTVCSCVDRERCSTKGETLAQGRSERCQFGWSGPSGVNIKWRNSQLGLEQNRWDTKSWHGQISQHNHLLVYRILFLSLTDCRVSCCHQGRGHLQVKCWTELRAQMLSRLWSIPLVYKHLRDRN